MPDYIVVLAVWKKFMFPKDWQHEKDFLRKPMPLFCHYFLPVLQNCQVKINLCFSLAAPVQWYTMDMGLNEVKPHCGRSAKPLPGGKTPTCNPDDPKRHCCSPLGFCGTGPDHCECEGCTNFANSTASLKEKNWFTWSDGPENAGRCGPTAPRLNGKVAGCDGSSPLAYCCGSNGYCGSGPEYCDCPKCVNFRNNPDFDWSWNFFWSISINFSLFMRWRMIWSLFEHFEETWTMYEMGKKYIPNCTSQWPNKYLYERLTRWDFQIYRHYKRDKPYTARPSHPKFQGR